MDNIIIKKIYQDSDLIELSVRAESEYIKIVQSCYVQISMINDFASEIISFPNNYKDSLYLEFGNKLGNYTPAFSMLIASSDLCGHVKIEMDMEIDDNNMRLHRCKFYIRSELGLIEKFGKKLRYLVLPTTEIGDEIELSE